MSGRKPTEKPTAIPTEEPTPKPTEAAKPQAAEKPRKANSAKNDSTKSEAKNSEKQPARESAEEKEENHNQSAFLLAFTALAEDGDMESQVAALVARQMANQEIQPKIDSLVSQQSPTLFGNARDLQNPVGESPEPRGLNRSRFEKASQASAAFKRMCRWRMHQQRDASSISIGYY